MSEPSWILNLLPRKPDKVIGGEDDPYLRRWYCIRTPWFQVLLHQFLRSDDDRALHDHPWRSASLILRGQYVEVLPVNRNEPSGATVRKLRRPLRVYRRSAEDAHRVELIDCRPVWTLFFTGPYERSWGFWCRWGWRHWREFTAGERGEVVGRGCD